MSHEITNADNVVLHKVGAWHGLGIVVADAPTPREGLKLAGIDWGVEQYPLVAKLPDGTEVEVDSHVLNYRSDTKSALAVVSAGYQPIQNGEMADFCEALTDQDTTVRCETIGSIRGGKQVWFLLKGEAFNVAKGDEIYPYILVSNGHDGNASFRVTPTTVRTVCSNTLHMVIPSQDTGELMSSAITLHHTKNVMERVTEAKRALQNYGKAMEQTKEVIQTLAGKSVGKADLEQFFIEAYQEQFTEIPTNPQNKVEQNRRDKAMSAYGSFTQRFDDEASLTGASLWGMFNAWSGLVQHDQKARGKDDIVRVEKRVESNLFGLNQKRTADALNKVYKMVV